MADPEVIPSTEQEGPDHSVSPTNIPGPCESQGDRNSIGSLDVSHQTASDEEEGRTDQPNHVETESSQSISTKTNNEKLLQEIIGGNEEAVRDILRKGVDINSKDNDYGETALHLASRYGHAGIVDILLESKADIQIRDRDEWTPLISACTSRSAEVVRSLLRYIPPQIEADYINISIYGGSTALTMACQYSTSEVIHELLNKKADVNTRDDDGDTPLILAAHYGDAAMVEDILTHDPDIYEARGDGGSALHEAIKNENRENKCQIVEKLLQKESLLGFRDNQGRTPLHIACERGDLQVVEKLVDQPGIDVNAPDYNERTPLHAASEKNHVEVVQKLLRHTEIDVNAEDDDWLTVLHIACDQGYLGLVEKFLSHPGIHVNTQDIFGNTPLHKASERNALDVAVKLISHNETDLNDLSEEERVNINAQNTSGLTALHLACQEGHIGVARILFNKGAQSRIPGGKMIQSAWFLFVKFLFETKQEPSKVSQDDVKCILEHADMEEMANATIWAKSDEDLKFLAGKMQISVSTIEDYELIRLARMSDREDIIEKLKDDKTDFKPLPTTALQWAAFHGKHVVVWWLLANCIPDQQAERDRETAKQIATMKRIPKKPVEDKKEDTKGVQDKALPKKTSKPYRGEGESNRSQFISFGHTVDMLEDPPPVESTFAGSYDKYFAELQLNKNELKKHRAMIVDFYQRDGRVDFLRRTRPVYDVIYADTSDTTEGGAGPKDIMEKAKSALRKISPKAGKQTYQQAELRVRWVHLPGNHMEWMEHLAMRIYKDNSKSHVDWSPLYDQIRRSQHELPTSTSETKYMKPVCLKESISRQKGTRDQEDVKPGTLKDEIGKGNSANSRIGNQTISGNEPGADGLSAQKSNKSERVALYLPYIRFGECFRKGGGRDPESLERYEELMGSSNRIHGTRSLDQFYYHSLSPSERLRRDENQVVTRLFLGKENGDGVPEGTNSWPFLTVDQLWLWIIDEQTIITSSTHRPDGFEDPIVERMFHRLREVKQKQIGQPPPSSVEEMSRFLVLSCIDFINSLGWKDFAPNLAADKFSKEDIGSKPIKSLYADKINQAAVKEKSLFANFKKKMKTKKVESEEERRKKEISMGKNEEKPQGLPATSNEETLKTQEPRDSRKSNYIKKLCRFVKNKLKGNPHKGNNNDEVKSWTSISEAAVLLDEVKDILDELTILKALVGQQQYVWQSLIGRDRNPEQENARGPAYTLLEIDEMIKMTTTVQESVNEMLNLEQNGISIMEATISRKQADENARQGKILMAFTIVTVVFTPLSFLTSLFALNVTVFQRNSQGEIEYEPGWIFPIIFCVSAGIIGPLMVYASFDDVRRGVNVVKNAIKNLVGRQHPLSQNPDIEKGQIENSVSTTAAQSPSQSTDSEGKP